jgi:uncharacterized protein Veg
MPLPLMVRLPFRSAGRGMPASAIAGFGSGSHARFAAKNQSFRNDGQFISLGYVSSVKQAHIIVVWNIGFSTKGSYCMNLAKQSTIIESIHDTLNDFVGQRLEVRANMGRSKIMESEGVLTQVHPQLFIMEVDRKRGRKMRQSYQYVDVLTGMVTLSQNGESLFDNLIDELSDKPAEKEEAAVAAEGGNEAEA